MGLRHLYLVIPMFLSGCAAVNVFLPESRLESPEVVGETGRVRLGFDLASSHRVSVIEDASLRPPTVGTAGVSNVLELTPRFSMGVWDRFEFGVRRSAFGNMWRGMGKLQLLGDSAMKAGPGNISLTITGSMGWSETVMSGDQLGSFGPGGFPWGVRLNTVLNDYAAILGIRFNDHVLMYGGPFIMQVRTNGTIHQDQSDNGLSPAADYEYAAVGENRGGNLAFQFNPSAHGVFSITIEVVSSQVTWDTSTFTDLQSGLLFDWSW